MLSVLLVGCKPSSDNRVGGKTEGEWIAQLSANDESQQTQAVQTVALYRNEAARNALRNAAKDQRVSVRYYAAEALWGDWQAPEAIEALRSVINDKEGWAYRDRMIPLLQKMGPAAKSLVPDIEKAIDNSPNSKVAKWQEVLGAAKG